VDTWTIRYIEVDGRTVALSPMSEGEAKGLLDGVRRHVDPAAVLVDLVEEISARLPVGARIRHTVHGWAGTVVTDDPGNAPFPGALGGGPIAYVPVGSYTGVCVRFDRRGWVEWFDAEFIALSAAT
jgi:hypothetical protein